MKRTIVLLAMLLFTAAAFAQNTYKAVIKDAEKNKPLPGATVKVVNTDLVAVSDQNGSVTFNNIPSGKQIIQYSFIGFKTQTDTLTFPLDQTAPKEILLQEAGEGGEKLEEVTISATRSSRTIANIPTRVEVISGEELDEKGNMKPGDIRMLLAESMELQ